MLYNKYRPSTLEEVVGQVKVKNVLSKIIEKPLEDAPQVYMLSGPTGTGKTTVARILKEHFKIHDESYTEINSADKTGVNDARALSESFNMLPMHGERTMVVLDECHMLSSAAWNQLLKPLEDTPKHVIIVLCTSVIEKVIPAVKKGRYQLLDFSELKPRDLGPLLQKICKKENKVVEKKVLQCIVGKAEGSARFSITMLESIIDLDNEEDMLEVISGSIDKDMEEFYPLCQAILNLKNWNVVLPLLQTITSDPESIRFRVLDFMSKAMMNPKYDVDQANDVIKEFKHSFSESGKAGLYHACFEAVSE